MFSVNSVDTACSVQPKRPREIELFDFVFRVQTEVACTSMRHLSMVTKNGQAHVCQCEIDYSHCWVNYYYIAVFSKNTGGNWLEHAVVGLPCGSNNMRVLAVMTNFSLPK